MHNKLRLSTTYFQPKGLEMLIRQFKTGIHKIVG